MSLPPLNLAPSTELEAVNALLQSIGQSPVNTLEVPGVKDVSIAQMTLHQISREVQSEGWYFNTDNNYPLSPDLDGYIAVPENALNVEEPTGDVVERARKLYRRSEHTFEFTKPVEARVTWFYDFEDLPQPARAYITAKAGRKFQTNVVASRILYEFTKESEIEARASLYRLQLRNQPTNQFGSFNRVNRIFQGR